MLKETFLSVIRFLYYMYFYSRFKYFVFELRYLVFNLRVVAKTYTGMAKIRAQPFCDLVFKQRMQYLIFE